MAARAVREAPLDQARTQRCEWILENLDLIAATGDDRAVYEDLQIDFWNETATFRIDNKARQFGYSFAAAADAVAAGWLQPGTVSQFISYNLDESKQKIRYAKAIIDALWPGVRPKLVVDNVLELEIENGSRILSLPSRPPRGGPRVRYYGDEFAHLTNDRAVYRAMLGGLGRGGVVRLGSTPLGMRGIFYSILSKPGERKGWVKGTWPWWLCYGLCTDVAAAREDAPGMSTHDRVLRWGTDRLIEAYEAYGLDLEGFQQEYECEFVDEEGAFFSYDLIMSCEPTCPDDCEKDCTLCEMFKPKGDGAIGLGFDVGRHKDRSAIVGLQEQDVRTVVNLDVMHRMPFPEQRRLAGRRVDELKPLRTCGDYIGMGGPILEELQERYGKSRVEGVILSNRVKEEIMTGLKALFEKQAILIPPDKRMRAHLHAIRQERLKGGGFRYDSESDETGHADIAWALGLANMALGTARGPGLMPVAGGERLDWDVGFGDRSDW